jgi:hypothetical protein
MSESNSSQYPENPYSAPQADVPACSFPVTYDQVPPQLNWKLTTAAWLILLSGFGLLLSTEYILRSSRSDKRLPGIPSGVGLGVILILGVVSVAILWKATKPLHSKLLRFVIVVCHEITALALYAVMIFYYVYWYV